MRKKTRIFRRIITVNRSFNLKNDDIMSNSSGKIVFGFVFGAAVGVAAGLLFAPTSGKETRKKVSEMSKEYSDDLGKQFNEKFDELKVYVKEKTDEAKERVKKAMPEESK